MDEYELTFLPLELPADFDSLDFVEMHDLYIPLETDHPIMRIRKQGDNFEITKKEPVKLSDASHQFENTIKLTEEEYNSLKKSPGSHIFKKRFYFTDNGFQYEIDIFKDKLAGLVLVDVEFSSKEEMDLFKKPYWLGAEVTNLDFIAGGLLANKKYSDISDKLSKYDYSKITL